MKRQNRSPFRAKTRNYRIENKDNKEATVYLYDVIDSWYGISAEQFIKDFNALEQKTVHLRINSPGGSVFDGTSIYNTIKQSQKTVIVHIDGLAASIASIIALAGDEVRIAENAYLMIHEPWSLVIGNADDMRKEADLLDKVSGTIASTYVKKTGKNEEEISAMMAVETWMTGNEALEHGFVDYVDGDVEDMEPPSDLFDLSVFNNLPETLKQPRITMLTKKQLEDALRDAGLTQKEAKTVLAKGFHPQDEPERDAQAPPERDVQDHAEAEPKVGEPERDAQAPTPKARKATTFAELMAL